MYLGISVVLGIRGGEVYVYGVFGCGVKELFVVDMDQFLFSKLIDVLGVEVENFYVEEIDVEIEFIKCCVQVFEIQILVKEMFKELLILYLISSCIEVVLVIFKFVFFVWLFWFVLVEFDVQSFGNF